jgi:hypothetical protein
MKLESLLLEARTHVTSYKLGTQAAIDMGLTDRSAISETFCLELFREVFELPHLQDLNAERSNAPGLDLGDETTGIAFQITSTPAAEKVKKTLTTTIDAGLHLKYPHVRIFVLTQKKNSYPQKTLDRLTDGKLKFSAKTDIFDWSDILQRLRRCELDRLERAVRILRKHIPQQTTGSPDPGAGEALERDLAQRYHIAQQRSAFPEVGNSDPFRPLAEEVLKKGIATMSSALARRILLRASRVAAITQRLDDARQLLKTAERLEGPDSSAPAHARIAEASGQVAAAIQLLRDESDPDARSMLLDLLTSDQGDARALEHFAEEKWAIADLSALGVRVLGFIYLRQHDVDGALRVLDSVSEKQITDCPYLLLLRGTVRLASIFPKPDQYLALGGLPINVSAAHPLLGGAVLATQLDVAIADLQRLVPKLSELGLRETSTVTASYLTWCRLLHPYRRTAMVAELRKDMQEPMRAVQFVQFAFEFDPEFNPAPLEAWLAKREKLGGLTDTELRALLIIRMRDPNARALASLIASYREQLHKSLGRSGIVAMEIQALALASDAISARVLLQSQRECLDKTMLVRLESTIATAEGADPLAELHRAYEATDSTDALRSLVGALAEKKDHLALAQYAQALFGKTEDLHDLVIAAGALINAGERQRFIQLIETHPALQERDPRLANAYARELLHTGRFAQVRAAMQDARKKAGATRDLDLEIALAIESGRWEQLGQPLAAMLEEADRHDGLTLIRAADLAQASGQGPLLELVKAAVRRAANDASVLMGAYLVTIEEGLEEARPEAHEWFQKAIDVSGPDGPIRRFELKELLKHQLDWNERIRKINDAIVRGDAPLIVAAQALRTTVVDLVLGNLVLNPTLPDARQMAMIPLFTGRRPPGALGDFKRLALDISSTLVLGWLGLLPKVLTSFPEVVVPAGLFYELFTARRRIRQSQKSQLVKAKQRLDLINNGQLKLVTAWNGAPDGRAREIGQELSDLLRAAEANDGLVIRPPPVHRIGSEDFSDADVSSFANRITDLHALLSSMKSLGALDQASEEAADRYFKLQDPGWAAPITPKKSTPLYLDQLAVSYLQTTRLLGSVASAFDAVYVHDSLRAESTDRLTSEARANEVLRTIDVIREAILEAERAGRIIFGPRALSSAREDSVDDSSSRQLLANFSGADVVVFDDRVLNKEPFAIDETAARARCVSSLDLIEELTARGLVSEVERRNLRHRLREAGAGLMPADGAEIRLAAQRSGQFHSPEFRSLHESISLARIREVPRFPSELPWLAGLLLSTKHAVIDSWDGQADLERAEEVANEIFNLMPNAADWLTMWEGTPPSTWEETFSTLILASLALPIELKDPKVLEAYHSWLDRHALDDLRVTQPERYARIVEKLRSFLTPASAS